MEFFSGSPRALLRPFVTGLFAYVGIILCTRLFGLRSFSKMSSFDLAVTVAIGSAFAAVTLDTTNMTVFIKGAFMPYTEALLRFSPT